MMEWSRCGLSDEDIKKCSRASYEAYISLTLSSIERTVEIPKKSILLLREDHKSCDPIKVVSVDEGLNATVCEKKLENKIWDGEALLDRSIFELAGDDIAYQSFLILSTRAWIF